MLTISALRDYMHVALHVDFNFCSLISIFHTTLISYKYIILTQKAKYSSLELVLFKIQNVCNPTYLLSDTQLKLE